MANKTYIRRSKHDNDNPYFMMLRTTAQDRALSFEARGMLAYILSRPDDWQIIITDLYQKCGKARVYKTLGELIEACYVERVYHRDTKGKITSVEYVTHEQPFTDYQEMGLQEMANPLMANPPLHNTDKEHKKEGKKKREVTPLSPIGADLIKAWLTVQHAIDPNAYAIEANRKYANSLADSGITPTDMTDFIEHKQKDEWWKGKFMELKSIAKMIGAWKNDPERVSTHIDPELALMIDFADGLRRDHPEFTEEKIQYLVREWFK